MPTLYYDDGRPDRHVKSLSWLVNHAGEVRRIKVEDSPVRDNTKRSSGYEVRLLAYLNGGIKYSCFWAKKSACREWLNKRRVLTDVSVDFCGESFVIPENKIR